MNASADSILIVRTKKELNTVAEDLPEAVARNGFGIMATHNLKETMAKKGVEFSPECRIFEVCNPQQAKKVLEENMAISTALPCRISLYQDGDESVMATFKPTAMLDLFGRGEAAEVAEEVEATMIAIMNEAAN